MLGQILPAAVATSETSRDDVEAALYPEEQAAIVRAVAKRRAEYATGRTCARRALHQLGWPMSPVPSGPNREPRWPPGVVGSITHCDGYRAAAVARSAEVATVGIDAEIHAQLPDGVLGRVAVEEERSWLRDLGAEMPGVCWDRVLFSAKEAVYKAWYPVAARWLGFDQAVITVDPAERTFQARLLVSGPVLDGRELLGFRGRWLVEDGLVLTAIVVDRRPEASSATDSRP